MSHPTLGTEAATPEALSQMRRLAGAMGVEGTDKQALEGKEPWQ